MWKASTQPFPCLTTSPCHPLLLPAEGRAGAAQGQGFPQRHACRITSPLRNSALAIEKGKVCTACSPLKETHGVIQDTQIPLHFFASLFKLWKICVLGAITSSTPRNFEVGHPLFVVPCNTSLHEKMCLFPTTPTIQRYPIWGNYPTLPYPQTWASNCAYHTTGNERRYLIFSSFIQTHLCHLSALSAEGKPKNTKAGMLQVTAVAAGEWMSFLLALWSGSPQTHAHAHTHKHDFFFLLGQSEFLTLRNELPCFEVLLKVI